MEQKMKRLIYSMFLVPIIILSLLACTGKQPVTGTSTSPPNTNTPVPLTKIRLPMGYIPSIQYAPFYVADKKGYFREAGLELDFDYSTETDGVALVGSENLQFSLASGEQVLLARNQGLPVVYVMNWWRNYPVEVAAKAGTGLKTPQDLKGKKIGLPGLYGASYIGLRALLNVAGLQEKDVTLDSIGYNQVPALIADQDQAIVVYANNEPIQLRAQGYNLEEIRVADYVELASNGLITNEKTIAENPALVQGMVKAITHGVRDTIANPGEAFEISKSYIEGLGKNDKDVQNQILATSIEFWKGDHLGESDPGAWENMQKVLLDMGLLKKPLQLDQAYSNAFVAP
jgi:putative riboflavin transport system substrate-binding protein